MLVYIHRDKRVSHPNKTMGRVLILHTEVQTNTELNEGKQFSTITYLDVCHVT